MLLKCPECDLQVSDKALTCPHCGYPMKEETRQRAPRKSNKRRRLPNGFGQISEIKGQSLRKPFRAMVTVGKQPNGRPIVKPLKPESYFETYNDAYAALVEYNRNPYDLAPTMTMQELYDKWNEDYTKINTSESSMRAFVSVWRYCSAIHNMRVTDLRARHIKGCMEDGVIVVNGEERHTSAGVKARMKSMFNLMLDYAVEYEIVEKNYARTFTVSGDIQKERKRSRKSHIPFTDDEMSTLWENVTMSKWIEVILIQCYMGWRPRELGLLRVENVNLANDTITGGMKTDAGINRIVPIHSKIKPFVVKWYREAVELGSEYLFNCTDGKSHKDSWALTYDKYQQRLYKIRDMLKLNPEHKAHDGRMHFVTQAKKYNLDEYAIKYIVGHSINDITEKIYTQRDIDWLKSEIEKIK